MEVANRNEPRLQVHRHVTERISAFLTVPQQACARRASKALWEAARAASMEDMLRAAVFEHQDASAVDAQLVVVAMSRVVGPFASVDSLVAWCGGLALVYDELQLRFPHAAAIGVSARLAAIRPFPFASGSTVMTVCVLTATASAPSALVLESVVLGVRNATNVLVRALSHSSPCPILCLEGATPVQFRDMVHDVLLSSLPPIRRVEEVALRPCSPSLRSLCLANLPLLESIGKCAFAECVRLFSVELSGLPSLRTVGKCAFKQCVNLQSISLENLPLLDSIGDDAFSQCVCLSSFCFSALPSLRRIGGCAFWKCESLPSINLTNLPLESIGGGAFALCAHLSSVVLSGLPSLCLIKDYAFTKCESLQSVSLVDLPLLESIGDYAFAECGHLCSVELSGLLSLSDVRAFEKCKSLQSISLANLPALSSVDLSRLRSLCTNSAV